MKHLLMLIGRELDVLAHKWTWYGLRLLVPCLGLAFVVLSLQRHPDIHGFGSEYLRFSFGRMFYQRLLMGIILFLMLVMPAICVRAIAGEREGETIGLLLLTRLSAFRVIASKTTAALLALLVVAAGCLPAVLVFSRFVEPMAPVYLVYFGLLVPFVITSFAVCICLAAFLPSRLGAYLAGLGGITLLLVLPILTTSVYEPSTMVVVVTMLAELVLVPVFLVMAARALERPYRRPRPLRVEVQQLLSRLSFVDRLLKQRYQLRGKAFAWHARRYLLMGRWPAMALWLVLIGCACLVAWERARFVSFNGCILFWGVVVVGASSYCSSQILTSERRLGTLSLLAAVPAGLRKLVAARVGYGLRQAGILTAGGGLPLLVYAIAGGRDFDELFILLYWAILFAGMGFLVGFAIGLLLPRPLSALVAALGSNCGLLIILVIVAPTLYSVLLFHPISIMVLLLLIVMLVVVEGLRVMIHYADRIVRL